MIKHKYINLYPNNHISNWIIWKSQGYKLLPAGFSLFLFTISKRMSFLSESAASLWSLRGGAGRGGLQRSVYTDFELDGEYVQLFSDFQSFQ